MKYGTLKRSIGEFNWTDWVWEVARTVKHDSNEMEFEVRFGCNVSTTMHQIELRLKPVVFPG